MAKANGNRGSGPVVEPYQEGAGQLVEDQTPKVTAREVPQEPISDQTGEPDDGKLKMVALTVHLPIGPLSKGYLSREVTTVTMNGREATAFNMLLNGLDQSDARLDDGAHVGAEKAKLFRWVMSKIADAIGL